MQLQDCDTRTELLGFYRRPRETCALLVGGGALPRVCGILDTTLLRCQRGDQRCLSWRVSQRVRASVFIINGGDSEMRGMYIGETFEGGAPG